MNAGTSLPPVSVQERVERIEKLDLRPIMVKLMDTNDGKGWSIDQCLAAEVWYKRFLRLNVLYPDKDIVPNEQIDAFWHAHILDTMKYQEDCEYVFGHFLHHFPYLGMRGADDEKELEKAYEDTLDLFSFEYGEALEVLSKMFSLEITCGSHCTPAGKNRPVANCHSTCHISCGVSRTVRGSLNYARPTLPL